MKKLIKKLIPFFDLLFSPVVFCAALTLKVFRKRSKKLPLCKSVLLKVGIFPILNHYYEPQFDFYDKDYDFSKERNLPGINWNIQEQLNLLLEFKFGEELKDIPDVKRNELEFSFNNNAFESGDAEYWYQLIRLKKPKRIIEIGSGNSTLMAIKAISENKKNDPTYMCEHICIEPYEMPWLEKSGVTVLREKVENVDLSFFSSLEYDDILFIDSSHIIRPEGDVVFEYLQLLPTLKKGVIVHVHDIFSPRNYLNSWIKGDMRFWNEQYLLEAFLTHNSSWEVIGSLNYLHHNYYNKLNAISPFLTPEREPGSFYMQKIT